MLRRFTLLAMLALAPCAELAPPDPRADDVPDGWDPAGNGWGFAEPDGFGLEKPRIEAQRFEPSAARRSEPSAPCFPKSTTAAAVAVAVAITPAAAVLKPPEFNKKHPSIEYQVYSSSVAASNANPFAPSEACGETTAATTKKPESTAPPADKKVVGEIIDQLKDINTVAKGDDAPAAVTCNRDGSWYSEAGGVRIDLVTADPLLHVEVVESVPKRDGLLTCEGWNLTGQLPYPEQDAPFLLVGTNDLEKVVAAFVGQCSVCGGHEKVVGKWLVVEEARDCANMLTATAEVPDVFHRELLHALKADRLARLNLTGCFPSTPHHAATTALPHARHNHNRTNHEKVGAGRSRRHQAAKGGARWKREGGGWKHKAGGDAGNEFELTREDGGRAGNDLGFKREYARAGKEFEWKREDGGKAGNDLEWKREDGGRTGNDLGWKRKDGGARSDVVSKKKRRALRG